MRHHLLHYAFCVRRALAEAKDFNEVNARRANGRRWTSTPPNCGPAYAPPRLCRLGSTIILAKAPRGRSMASVNREILMGEGLRIAGTFLALGGIGVLGYQGLLWLQDGGWTPLEFRVALQIVGAQEPFFVWRGVQKISVWFFDQSLSAVMITLGLSGAIFGAVLAEEGYTQRSATGPPKKLSDDDPLTALIDILEVPASSQSSLDDDGPIKGGKGQKGKSPKPPDPASRW
jgi:hypothetical protein